MAEMIKPEYTPPTGVQGTKRWGKLECRFEANWIVLRKKEKPAAEMFFISYELDKRSSNRPITFSFNGGPGAASAYLHLGALGPQRLAFGKQGQLEKSPAELTPNAESWLAFTDLVFVDPIGTGYSRPIDEKDGDKKENPEGKESKENKEFFEVEKDIEAMCEFINKYLGKAKRWGSPVFIVGESYGGFRVGRLVKKLQENYGVGLSGAVLVSPALEMNLLNGSDYNVVPWLDVFPSFAATAHHHGRSSAYSPKAKLEEVLGKAEAFALNELGTWLLSGEFLPEEKRKELASAANKFLGLTPEYVSLKEGRISPFQFVRELMRDKRLLLGLYDATLSGFDPYPDREVSVGPDATLSGLDRLFGTAANRLLRQDLGLVTDRDYHLLSYDVFNSWKMDPKKQWQEMRLGSSDELRYGMALNPHMKVMISHGIYDLITPYFSSERLVRQMRLPAELRKNLSLKHYRGGHMFYMWEESRVQLFKNMNQFYEAAL